MAKRFALLLVWSTIYTFVHSRGLDSYTFTAERDVADQDMVNSLSPFRRKLSGSNVTLPSTIGRSLYWFGQFTVGSSGPLRLLIDTGSTDLWLNYGVYKPSNNEKPYSGNITFGELYEGVNRDGYGYKTVNGTVHEDVVTGAGLTVENQAIGNITSWNYIDVPQLPYATQGQGVIGWQSADTSAYKPGAPSWFYNLCNQGIIAQQRFALAFGTSGKGFIVIGKLARDLIKGSMVSVPLIPEFGDYTVIGDITLDNEIVVLNQTILMDVGTNNIQGPLEPISLIFDKLGYQTSLLTEPQDPFVPGEVSKNLLAFFPCDTPPNLGFSFPAQSQLEEGQEATIFNVSPSAWDVYDNGNNNCTSILGGTNAVVDLTTGNEAWLLGQPFFAGHYIDFNLQPPGIGYANLQNPSDPSSA